MDARLKSELFELELLGAGSERRYRKARPDVAAMPWGTLEPKKFPKAVVDAARKTWSLAAFQEHRTAVAMAQTVKALIEARAPLDLVGCATRFPLDEIAHVELCARMTMELGGALAITHDPDNLVARPLTDVDPVLRAADMIVRFFCVGEALSIPMLRGTWRAATHPLPRAVLGRIVKDEAAHGAFGWTFLDWALPHVAPEDYEVLAHAADRTIELVKANWVHIRRKPKAQASPGRRGPDNEQGEIHSLGWMESAEYIALAEKSLERNVLRPLRARSIPVTSTADVATIEKPSKKRGDGFAALAPS